MSDCDNMPQVFSSAHYWYLSENSDFFSMEKGEEADLGSE